MNLPIMNNLTFSLSFLTHSQEMWYVVIPLELFALFLLLRGLENFL